MGSSIKRRVVSLAAALALVASLSARDGFARDVKTITEVEVREEQGMTRIILRGATDPIYTAFLREDPPRLIIELPDVMLDRVETPIRIDNGVVNDVTLAAFGDPQVSSSMVRISVGLADESEYELIPNGDELIIQVRSLLSPPMAPTVVAQVQPEPAALPAALDEDEEVVAERAPEPEPEPSAAPQELTHSEAHALAEGELVVPAQKARGASRIQGLVVEDNQVHVIADGPIDSVDAFRLKEPARLVVDFWGARNAVFPNRFTVDSGLIQQVRIGQHADKVRVVLDLRGEVTSHTVEASDNGVRIALNSDSVQDEDEQAASAARPMVAAPALYLEENEDGQGFAGEQNVWVKGVRFESLPSADRVVLDVGAELQALVYEPDPITVVIDLPGSRIEPESERRIDTREFGGPLEMFSVFQTPDVPREQVRVVLKRRGSDKVRLSWEDGRLLIELPRASRSAYLPGTTVPAEFASAVPGPGPLAPAPMGPPESAMGAPASFMGPPAPGVYSAPGMAPGMAAAGRPGGPIGPLLPAAFGVDPLFAGPAEPASIDILEEGGFDDEKTYNGRRISLDFKDADIANILRLIAEVSDLNIIAGEEVDGKVTIRLVDVPWDQAMDVILLTKGLGFVRVGNVLRIAPLETLKAEKEARLMERRSREKLEDLVVKLQPVNYADVKEMKDMIQHLLSARGSVMVDTRTNTLIIKDIPSVIHEATALVKAIDTQTPQVLIEAKIVEANLTFARALGANWGLGFTGTKTAGGVTTPSAGGFPDLHLSTSASGLDPLISLPNGEQQSNFISMNPVSGILNGVLRLGLLGHDDRIQLDLALMAAESNNRGKVISSPRVVTLDNREAIIKQGVAIKFTEITRDTVTTSFVDAVLELKVTPHITADRSIIMKVKVSRNAPQLSSASGDIVGITKNETETEALVRDGETMVLGGIYVVDSGKSTTKLPFLADIPLLGAIFRSKTIQDERRELLIFVTPRIITSPSSDF